MKSAQAALGAHHYVEKYDRAEAAADAVEK
jgi:hypothetical protein